MKKIIGLLLLLIIAGIISGLIRDRDALEDNVIRLHIVGASDDDEDQKIKLSVRDAVNKYLYQELQEVDSVEDARDILEKHLDDIKCVADHVLKENDCSGRSTVTLQKESFPKRSYDTFSLPSGQYDSLRIVLEEGEGKNWWCVVFPSLCIPASTEEFQDMAVSSGFDNRLTNTLSQSGGYEIRFFFLDLVGKLENLLESF